MHQHVAVGLRHKPTPVWRGLTEISGWMPNHTLGVPQIAQIRVSYRDVTCL